MPNEDDLKVINNALARIGGNQVFAVDEDSDLAAQAFAVYDDLLAAAIELYDWWWPRRTVPLEALPELPFGYNRAFAFPALAVSNPSALYGSRTNSRSPIRDFRVEGRTVALNSEECWGNFAMRVSPADWPPAFRLAFTVWLSGELAVPVTHDVNLSIDIAQKAIGTPSEGGRGGLMGRAIAIDTARSGGVAPLLADDPLTSVHHGSDTWSGGGSGW
jgi:hypothetical protein